MKPSARHRLQLGKTGEDIATSFLQGKGYRILERNFRVRYGELDIVAESGDAIVAVEVKTRRSRDFGLPEEAVTPRKLTEIVNTLSRYAAIHRLAGRPLRVDVVAVETDGSGTVEAIRHLVNVTG
jgi:putative endonuclease